VTHAKPIKPWDASPEERRLADQRLKDAQAHGAFSPFPTDEEREIVERVLARMKKNKTPRLLDGNFVRKFYEFECSGSQ
jgi:hypothetical protein